MTRKNETRVSAVWGFEAGTKLEVPLFTTGIYLPRAKAMEGLSQTRFAQT